VNGGQLGLSKLLPDEVADDIVRRVGNGFDVGFQFARCRFACAETQGDEAEIGGFKALKRGFELVGVLSAT
jgi:hypothetical protein